MAFSDHFTFTRPSAAPYVDAVGVSQVAGVNQPRFDHSGRGRPTGLLVEAGNGLGRADRAHVITGDWADLAKVTVLHEWSDGSQIRYQAHYSADAVAMINGCLSAVGHHRRIAVMAGYLRNYGGWVWAIGQRWYLPPVIGTRGGTPIGSPGVPLLAT